MRAIRRALEALLLCAAVFLPVGVALGSPADESGAKWALLVGIGDYQRPEVPALIGADNDARAVRDALVQHCGFPADHVFMLTSDAGDPNAIPTRSNIAFRLGWLSRNAKPGDALVIFLSGHGVQTGPTENAYLLTHEADVRDAVTMGLTCLSAADLQQALSAIPASKVLLLLDACRSDPTSATDVDRPNALSEAFARAVRVAPKAQADAQEVAATVYACRVGQRAYEWPAKGHGFFAYYLVAGLAGRPADRTGSRQARWLYRHSLGQHLRPRAVRGDQRAHDGDSDRQVAGGGAGGDAQDAHRQIGAASAVMHRRCFRAGHKGGPSVQTSALARYGFAVFTLAAVFGLGTASVTPARAVGLPPVDLTRLKPASTTDVRQFPDDQVAIGGKAYDGYVGTDNWSVDTGWATWRVPSGYTRFEVEAGVNDESRQDKPSTFRVFVDGDLAKTVKVEPGAKAVRLSVAVRPGGSLKLQIDNSYYGVFAEPRLLAGAAAPPPPEPGDLPPSSPFVVDPRDIDRLAASLRQKADASPVLRQRLASGRVAVSTFSLIDVPSPSVAQNVAEDLYTAMINSGFALVERGQLDKVLKELKIQNMGQVDPKTAQRIGQLSGCDVILLGSISDRGQSVVINARLMEIATGQSIVADRVEMRKIPIAGGG